jgi:hypothetical protein
VRNVREERDGHKKVKRRPRKVVGPHSKVTLEAPKDKNSRKPLGLCSIRLPGQSAAFPLQGEALRIFVAVLRGSLLNRKR